MEVCLFEKAHGYLAAITSLSRIIFVIIMLVLLHTHAKISKKHRKGAKFTFPPQETFSQ
jgi:hypothetical protein